jgi:hypothetical protein
MKDVFVAAGEGVVGVEVCSPEEVDAADAAEGLFEVGREFRRESGHLVEGEGALEGGGGIGSHQGEEGLAPGAGERSSRFQQSLATRLRSRFIALAPGVESIERSAIRMSGFSLRRGRSGSARGGRCAPGGAGNELNADEKRDDAEEGEQIRPAKGDAEH